MIYLIGDTHCPHDIHKLNNDKVKQACGEFHMPEKQDQHMQQLKIQLLEALFEMNTRKTLNLL